MRSRKKEEEKYVGTQLPKGLYLVHTVHRKAVFWIGIYDYVDEGKRSEVTQ